MPSPFRRLRARPQLESLEDRLLLASSVLPGPTSSLGSAQVCPAPSTSSTPARILTASSRFIVTLSPGGQVVCSDAAPPSGWCGTPLPPVVTPTQPQPGSVITTPTPSNPHAPYATLDQVYATTARPVVIDVLANDRDPDGDTLQIVSFTNPGHGSVLRDPARPGSLIYTSAPGYTGLDTFEYRITDGKGNFSQTTVRVHVQPPPAPPPLQQPPANRPPIAVNDLARTTRGVAVTLDPLANDRDPDGDRLTMQCVTQPAHGTLAQQPGTGKWIYTPRAGYQGTDCFEYVVSDGRGGSARAKVSIQVAAPPVVPAQQTPANRPPIARNDEAWTGRNDVTRIKVLQNDSDPDGDRLRLVSVVSVSTAGGRVEIDPGDAKKVRYTPPRGFTGQDTFTYVVGDGRGGQATATVMVRVGSGVCDWITDLFRW